MNKVCSNWQWIHNATHVEKGRVIVGWHPQRYRFIMKDMNDQLIHGEVTQLFQWEIVLGVSLETSTLCYIMEIE